MFFMLMFNDYGQITKDSLIKSKNSKIYSDNYLTLNEIIEDYSANIQVTEQLLPDIESSTKFSKVLPSNFLPDFDAKVAFKNKSPLLSNLYNFDLCRKLSKSSLLKRCEASTGLNNYLKSATRDDEIYQTTRTSNGLALMSLTSDPMNILITAMLKGGSLTTIEEQYRLTNHIVAHEFHESLRQPVTGSSFHNAELIQDRGSLYPFLCLPCFTSVFDQLNYSTRGGVRTTHPSAFNLLPPSHCNNGYNAHMTRPDGLFFSSYLNLFRMTETMFPHHLFSVDNYRLSGQRYMVNGSNQLFNYLKTVENIVNKLASFYISASNITANYGYSVILQYDMHTDAYRPYCFISSSYIYPAIILKPAETKVLTSFILGTAFTNNGIHIGYDSLRIDSSTLNQAIIELFNNDARLNSILRVLLFPSIMTFTLNVNRTSIPSEQYCFPFTDKYMHSSGFINSLNLMDKFREVLKLTHSLAILSDYYNTYNNDLPTVLVSL